VLDGAALSHDELTADHLDDWLDERAEEFSMRSLRLIHQIVERAIRQAQARDKVRRNVASLVDVPEGEEGRPSRTMTLGQAVALLETVGSGTHRLAAYVVLSLLVGVRTEEARAITWDEVDLKAGTVAVHRSARVKGDTKTRKSRHVLKLPTKAVQALRAYHTRQAAERLAAGETWQEHDPCSAARTARRWIAGT
jgi:integrase